LARRAAWDAGAVSPGALWASTSLKRYALFVKHQPVR